MTISSTLSAPSPGPLQILYALKWWSLARNMNSRAGQMGLCIYWINCKQNRSRRANKCRNYVRESERVRAVATPFFRWLCQTQDDFIVYAGKTFAQFISPFRLHITKRKHNEWTSYMDQEKMFYFCLGLDCSHHTLTLWTFQYFHVDVLAFSCIRMY